MQCKGLSRYARKEQQLEKLVHDEKKNLKEFYEQQLMESQVQRRLTLQTPRVTRQAGAVPAEPSD
jgi:hypothetical protein